MKRLGRALLILVLIGGLPLVALEVYVRVPMTHEEVVLEISEGESLQHIARALEQRHVIKYFPLFVAYGRLKQIDRTLKAGEYVFPSGLTPLQVMGKLARGEFRTFEITLLEGWTMRQMAEYLAAQSFITIPNFAEAFLAACRDPERIRRLGVSAESLEGFLFPDTYRVHRPRAAEDIVDLLVATFQQQFDAELHLFAQQRGMSLLEVVTLASIIEKETGSSEERPLVSAVFHNRLTKGMHLETDPTVIYGLVNFDGNLRRSDLENPHPYNTYVHAGLPPGPIANPGKAALEAAVAPAAVEYLYFVSRNDGTHVFSTDYRDHVNAVNRFQRGGP